MLMEGALISREGLSYLLTPKEGYTV